MNKTEAKQLIENFFVKLGARTTFPADKNFVAARVGEALIGFEFDQTEQILSAQALIYRFRRPPADQISDAVFAEENETNCGGGRLVFDSAQNTFYLQKDFDEKIADDRFSEKINDLARASLIWSSEILGKAAEKANA